MRDLDYLKVLSREFPTVKAASSEIINLKAICGLPKGTEYFFSDLHGEYDAFIHLLRSASGVIREKINETFDLIISEEEELALANLIYYPKKGVRQVKNEGRFTGRRSPSTAWFVFVNSVHPSTQDPKFVKKCRRSSSILSMSFST